VTPAWVTTSLRKRDVSVMIMFRICWIRLNPPTLMRNRHRLLRARSLPPWSKASPARSRRHISPALVIQFLLLTLSLVAIIYFVFELTANKLNYVESATLVVALVGFFYILVTWRGRPASRDDLNAAIKIAAVQSAASFDSSFDSSFARAAEMLSIGSRATLRLAGAYALARLADDRQENRQICVDVLCAYIRLPYLFSRDPFRSHESEATESGRARGHQRMERAYQASTPNAAVPPPNIRATTAAAWTR
jgi:hypothetical protein